MTRRSTRYSPLVDVKRTARRDLSIEKCVKSWHTSSAVQTQVTFHIPAKQLCSPTNVRTIYSRSTDQSIVGQVSDSAAVELTFT